MKSDRGPTQFEKVSSWSSCSYDTAHLQGPRQISTVLKFISSIFGVFAIHYFNFWFTTHLQSRFGFLKTANLQGLVLRFFKTANLHILNFQLCFTRTASVFPRHHTCKGLVNNLSDQCEIWDTTSAGASSTLFEISMLHFINFESTLAGAW